MEAKIIGGGMLAISAKTNRVLMIQRRIDVTFPMQWGIPGGHFEDSDEFPKVTAIREFEEETGAMVKAVSKQPIFMVTSNHVDYYTYLGIVNEEFVPNLVGEGTEDDKENVDYGWFPLDQIPDDSIEGVKEMIVENKDLIEACVATMIEKI